MRITEAWVKHQPQPQSSLYMDFLMLYMVFPWRAVGHFSKMEGSQDLSGRYSWKHLSKGRAVFTSSKKRGMRLDPFRHYECQWPTKNWNAVILEGHGRTRKPRKNDAQKVTAARFIWKQVFSVVSSEELMKHCTVLLGSNSISNSEHIPLNTSGSDPWVSPQHTPKWLNLPHIKTNTQTDCICQSQVLLGLIFLAELKRREHL